MDEEIYNRKFKLWFYQVTHSEAIIRSPKWHLEKTYDTNIDIYLGGIVYMEMPTNIQELEISNATSEDVAYIFEKTGKAIAIEKIIVFISQGRKYYVVASIVKIMKNDLVYLSLPIYTFFEGKKE